MLNMTVLVTGANGQLGREMRIVSADSGNRYVFADVVCPEGMETVRLDITDVDAVRRMVREYDVDVIVNCAAYTDVDKAESDVEMCTLLNVRGPENLAAVMKETGGLLVHVSTDYVFDGKSVIPYEEDMPCAPVCVYGITKFQGELAVQSAGCRHLIIRTSWLYSEFGKNFVRTMLALTSSRQHLDVVSDQTGTPTYALDLARVIYDIVEGGKSEGKDGIYHYSNEGVCTWYDLACAVAGFAGHTGCEISPCTSEEYPSPVKRPAYSVLDKKKIKDAFGIEVPFWRDSLKECLKKLVE